MARSHFVKSARKQTKADNGEIIKVGESYYWWKFNYGAMHKSKTQPKASQLTQSDFLSQVYDFKDNLDALTREDIDEGFEVDVSELENLRDEQEEKRSNMPEQLQDSGSGETLQNRYDSLEEWISELQAVDTSIDITEESIKKENDKEPDEKVADYNERIAELLEEAINERKDEILGEIQGTDYNGE